MKTFDRFRRRPDGRAIDSDPIDGADHRGVLAYSAMMIGVVAVTVLGPTLVDDVSSRVQRPGVTVVGAPPRLQNATAKVLRDLDSASPETAPSTTSAPTVAAPTVAAPTTAESSVTTETSPDAPRSTVTTIQLVPPLRDVIVEIGGQEFASDENGRIAVDPSSSDATFAFVGVRSQPSLRHVTFAQWADGSTQAERKLSELDGPVAQVGLVVSHRVVVELRPSTSVDATVDFVSAAGSIRIDVRRASWVPVWRAVGTEDGLVAEELAYTTTTMTSDELTTALRTQTFRPTPEALWVVESDPT